MSNPLFKQLGGQTRNQGTMSFPEFMMQMRGKNPSQIINSMLSNGQLTQNQLQQVQIQANQMRSQLEPFMQAFGFKK